LSTVVLLALYLLSGWPGDSGGLVRTVVVNPSSRVPPDVRRVSTIDGTGLGASANTPAGVTVTWQGAWYVTATGLYDLVLSSDGPSWWAIDGQLAVRVTSTGEATRTVWLNSGFHALYVSYTVDGAAPGIRVAAARTGLRAEPLVPGSLSASVPGHPRLYSWIRGLHAVLGWLALAALAWALRSTIASRRPEWRGWSGRETGGQAGEGDRRASRRAWLARSLSWAALAVILAHGALLRVDAIAGQYGVVSSPGWIAALQTRQFAGPERIRPGSVTWEPEPLYPHADGPPTLYRSDPYTYLDAARKMTSFYAAHWREPVFPFVTRVFLGLLDGRDVAVSFASAFCSVLAIWFTYLLGAAAWSRSVGLLAALGLSLDHDVLTLASRGWRDDAYVAAVALCAFLMLRCWRIGRAPVQFQRLGRVSLDSLYLAAFVLGLASGLAVLTRIMAVPFLAAGGAFLVFGLPTSWRRRLTMAGIGVATALIVAGPYFVNCWRVYGDPLYTFNVHGNIYSIREGEGEWEGSTVEYVAQEIAERPIAAVDTIAQGVTTYPFANKWHGLNRWFRGLGHWASVAAIGGLLVLAAFASGRLLLIATWASLLPFSFTWPSDPDFRFTVHVYPTLLVAAAVGVAAVCHTARAILVPTGLAGKRAQWRRRALAWAGVVGPAAVLLWLVLRVLPTWTFAEALRTGEAAMVTTGVRDGAFVGPGWSEVTGTGNILMRVATAEGTIWLPLPAVADYPVSLRLDPFPRPLGTTPGRLPVVEVHLNGVPLEAIPLGWNPDRVGSYTVTLPRTTVRRGFNRLVLRVRRADAAGAPRIHPGLSDGDSFGLWYVRVQPATSHAVAHPPPGPR
jgi:4-amino-4-deoxy-L-arabinose transferase-like glycosyltransferase